MPDYLARIRAKGLDSTGVTEALAKQFYSTLGSHHLAVVEFRVEDRRETADGKHEVHLILTQVEPSTVGFLDDHLREITRALYRNRALADGQAPLPGTDDGRTLQDVVHAGEAAIVRDDDGDPAGVWDGDTDAPRDTTALACPFPGCRLDPGHDGDHDPWGKAEAGTPVDLGDAAPADGLRAVPDPFTPA